LSENVKRLKHVPLVETGSLLCQSHTKQELLRVDPLASKQCFWCCAHQYMHAMMQCKSVRRFNA